MKFVRGQVWRAVMGLAVAGGVGSGCVTADRKASYPIGIYGVGDTNALRAVHEAGFNLVTGPADRRFLDAAGKLGVRVLVSPGTSAGSTFDRMRARRAVRAVDRHPAVWGWYLIDEPDLNQVSPEEVRAAHRFFKSTGARRPTAVVLYNGFQAPWYADIPDILMLDRYPIPWAPVETYDQHIRLARHSAGVNKRLIGIVQAFNWEAYTNVLGDVGPVEFRPPTYDELRAMSYMSLVEGVNGLFFYTYKSGSWDMEKQGEVWQSVRDVVAEIRDHEPLFAGRRRWWPWRNHLKFEAGPGLNAVHESSVVMAMVEVTAKEGTERVPQGNYLVAVNTTRKSVSVKVGFPGATGEAVQVLSERRSIALEGGAIRDEFGPLTVRVYGPL